MASRWFCKVLGKQMGPLSFRDLVELVRTGTLTENDPVRRDGSSQWTPAREVIGLFRAAAKKPAEAAPPEPETKPKPVQATRKPKPTKRAAAWLRRFGRRELLRGGALVVTLLVVTAVVWRLWAARPSRFPESATQDKPYGLRGVSQIRRRPPRRPSVPGLRKGVPQLVPGLEKFEPACSPSLSHDLKTIVFATIRDKENGYDLFRASRDDVSSPFGPPQRIHSCSSPEADFHPALSPDGLELIFVRSDETPRFFRATRSTPSDNFDSASSWPVPGLKLRSEQRLEAPRFIDAIHLAFRTSGPDGKDRSLWVVERPSTEAEFDHLRRIPVTDDWPMYCVAGSERRAFFGTPGGLYLTSRRDYENPFEYGSQLADAMVGGPVDGPVWVTPREDVVFYCSPGPGREMGSARRLWMIRY